MEKVSELQDLKNGQSFAWGKVMGIREFQHTSEVTTYAVMEFIWGEKTGRYTGRTGFLAFVDGKSTTEITPTFEGALLIAVSHITQKNSQDAMHAFKYAMRVFSIPWSYEELDSAEYAANIKG